MCTCKFWPVLIISTDSYEHFLRGALFNSTFGYCHSCTWNHKQNNWISVMATSFRFVLSYSGAHRFNLVKFIEQITLYKSTAIFHIWIIRKLSESTHRSRLKALWPQKRQGDEIYILTAGWACSMQYIKPGGENQPPTSSKVQWLLYMYHYVAVCTLCLNN